MKGADLRRISPAGSTLRSLATRYGAACLAVGLATGLMLLVEPLLGAESPFLLYVAAVMLGSLYGGLGPGLLAAVGSALIASYLFFAPRYSLAISSSQTQIRLSIFLVEALIISAICGALRRLYVQSRQQTDRMKALADLGRALSETLDVEIVARRVGQSIRSLLGAQLSVLYLLEEETGDLVAVQVAEDVAAALGPRVVFPRGMGVAGLAVGTRQPVATSNLLTDARVRLTAELRERIEAAPYRAVLAVPLLVKDRVIGALAVGDYEGRQFSEEEKSLAQVFGDHAARALENARLYQDVQSAYEKLSSTQAQLVRAATLEATGKLAAGAAHHLNNLLTIVLGRIQLLLRQTSVSEVRRHLEPAARAAVDSAEVVRRLSSFSRGRSERQRVAVDLNEIAAEVIELTRARWQNEAGLQGVAIDVQLTAGALPRVLGEPTELREVLVNLVLNAVDAMPQGGQIRIKTWATPAGVHCAVSDSGLGMSTEVQRRAFEPFFTTKGLKNTGLGLSVNYGIVQQHGGELTIDSTEGRGSTIAFRLPVATRADAPPRTAESPLSTPLQILLIDDDETVRQLIAEVLTEDGHAVVQADCGADGLACLESDPAVDLVLTDLGMPGMTGWGVAQKVKASHPSLPVGLVTGWGADPEGTPEERAAVDFIITKPVTRDALRDHLGHAFTDRGAPVRSGR